MDSQGNYNGATLVGLNGIVVKSHGSADSVAFQHAIDTAIVEVQQEAAATNWQPAAEGSRMTYSRIVGTGPFDTSPNAS